MVSLRTHKRQTRDLRIQVRRGRQLRAMRMVWTPIAATMIVLSSVASFFTMLHLRYRWDVQASSVRWLLWLFFFYLFAWCALRSVFFVWMSLLPSHSLIDVDALSPSFSDDSRNDHGDIWTPQEIDSLGIHAILQLKVAKNALMTFVLCAGDVAVCSIALTVFPLAFELARLARKSMDRGVEKEKRQINSYFLWIHVGVILYATAQLVLCIKYGGYNAASHWCLLALYVLEFVCMAFMAILLVKLKMNGRNFETIHGVFILSPIYERLKRIMFVYIFFSFQYQLTTLILFTYPHTNDETLFQLVGLSLILYNCTGLALSVTTSCSQSCVFSTCAVFLPEDFEAKYVHSRFGGPSSPMDLEDLEAPTQNPVFVYTDIESSSALWAIDDGKIMDQATEIHDNILRSSLPKYHGYEITTVGDAFQLAFRSIADAIEYCLDVQLQLLVAKWPKELNGAVSATEKVRSGRRVIFNGLRVRMGIHDAVDLEGSLVRDIHVVTGKTTYTGISDVIAEYIGDLGAGGQILVTDRVATWIKQHRGDLSVDIFMDRVGQYIVPHVGVGIEVFQLLPQILAGRARHFPYPVKTRSFVELSNSARKSRDALRQARSYLALPLLSQESEDPCI